MSNENLQMLKLIAKVSEIVYDIDEHFVTSAFRYNGNIGIYM